jgi:hypothetical protein
VWGQGSTFFLTLPQPMKDSSLVMGTLEKQAHYPRSINPAVDPSINPVLLN